MNTNIIIDSDSYKVSHWKQLPEGTTKIYSYLESRGGKYDSTMAFGFTPILREYLSQQITMEDIDHAEEQFALHFGDKTLFNRAGWERIVEVHNGYLPLEIKAVPEGTLVPVSNVLMTIVNTDDQLPWLTNYVETVAHRVWYPITVATTSFYIKRLIKRYLEKTGDVSGLDFKLHDFGSRGVSSRESAIVGGMAHLINFKGSDTMAAFEGAKYYYGEEMAGFSIPASEHSTITAWGEDNEVEAYRNMIKQFGNGALYACVSDSYDIYNACENLWGGVLKQEVLNAPGTLIIRPDSGDPATVVLKCVEILGSKFGYTTNDKGYKVLNAVRVIQGDGIDYDSIYDILNNLAVHRWSADNVAFGMGGALLQKIDRDTQKFAFKASAMEINGVWRSIWKDPITDPGKTSKRGKLKLVDDRGQLCTTSDISERKDLLELVYLNGHMFNEPTFQEIRDRVNSYL